MVETKRGAERVKFMDGRCADSVFYVRRSSSTHTSSLRMRCRRVCTARCITRRGGRGMRRTMGSIGAAIGIRLVRVTAMLWGRDGGKEVGLRGRVALMDPGGWDLGRKMLCGVMGLGSDEDK